MNKTRNDPKREDGPPMPNRRQLLGAGLGLAVASVLARRDTTAQAQQAGQAAGAQGAAGQNANQSQQMARRRLGSLEVSTLGLGVQNMSRTYQQTIPTRSEMLNIIRTAFDRGVTFYDAAEAYGPVLARESAPQPDAR